VRRGGGGQRPRTCSVPGVIEKDLSVASGSGGFMATRVYTMLPPTTTWMVVLPKRPRATELGTPFVTDLATPPATFTSILGVPLRLAVAVIFRALVPNASGTTYGPARVALNAGFSAPGATTRCSRWSLARISAAAGVSGAAVCVTGRVPAVSPSVTSAARVPATTDGCARIVLRLLSMRRAARVSACCCESRGK
jgi:hypothetical protein